MNLAEEYKAKKLAVEAAHRREDCDLTAVTIASVDSASFPGFILIEVVYDKAGHRALYEYRCRDGEFSLAQD